MTTQEELDKLEKEAAEEAPAHYNQTAAYFQEALQATAEAEAETQRAAENWRRRLLSLFNGDPGYIHDALMGATDPGPELTTADATAQNFTLGATPLGFTAVNWYRQAARDFEEGNYTDALAIFINEETAEQLAPAIEKAKKAYTKKRGVFMTLAAFLTREYNQEDFAKILAEYGYKPGDPLNTPEATAAEDEYTRRIHAGEIEPEPSIFDDLLYDISIPTINGKIDDIYIQGGDKASQNLTNISTDGEINTLRVDKVKSRGKPRAEELSILSSLDLQSLKEEYPQLAPVLDKIDILEERYYWAICTLWNKWVKSGRPGPPYLEITAGQIHTQAGFTSNLNAFYVKKIDIAVTKFSARFTLNNREEARKYKSYYYEDYDGPLMHIDRVHRRKTANGEIVNTVYRVYAEPILFKFASRRQQITAIPLAAQTLPQGVNATPRNLAIDKAIRQRFYNAKRGEKTGLRLETIYKAAGVTDKDAKKDVRAKVKKFLLHYRVTGVIKRYQAEDPKVYYFWK